MHKSQDCGLMDLPIIAKGIFPPSAEVQIIYVMRVLSFIIGNATKFGLFRLPEGPLPGNTTSR